eukprot:TRINITY_DN11933_c0_g1_i2.p1 TRINITY_DN11933_c0_g1~~TRINITY_DN11933_c0_g1_i2.p1  ORF type:complete len:205 (-),score=55.70 TRINITY_DN11933_c0_g1_i2:198-812(-)
MADPPMRIMNFISEQQLEEVRDKRGERVEDGAVQRDKTLYEILKENKDKQQAEFNERFKHRPPKALDEDETEFLEKVEMTKREVEQQVATEEAQELQNFKAAVASHTIGTLVCVEPINQKREDQINKQRENLEKTASQARQSLSSVIRIKPQAKKLKTGSENATVQVKEKVTEVFKNEEIASGDSGTEHVGLVSYSDESEDDHG